MCVRIAARSWSKERNTSNSCVAVITADDPRSTAAWLFPTTVFNVYPCGVSVNVVVPLAVDRTRVSSSPSSATRANANRALAVASIG
jgi:hypothetical protein